MIFVQRFTPSKNPSKSLSRLEEKKGEFALMLSGMHPTDASARRRTSKKTSPSNQATRKPATLSVESPSIYGYGYPTTSLGPTKIQRKERCSKRSAVYAQTPPRNAPNQGEVHIHAHDIKFIFIQDRFVLRWEGLLSEGKEDLRRSCRSGTDRNPPTLAGAPTGLPVLHKNRGRPR